MATTYLQRTPTARTNSKKFTYSCWFKRSKIASAGYLVINLESGNDRGYVVLDANDKFNVYDVAGGTVRLNILSNFVLRDTNAWYHLVYSVDSTAGSNRTKFYINGVDRYSDFTVTTARAQNGTVGFQQGTVSNSFKIGSQESGSTTFDGSMSHINFVDGLQLDASAFGETDSTTGEWKIKTSPTVSEYGNNGFFILKDGNSVTDQSGKGNNFTVGGGTLTKTEDNPSNSFATWNLNWYPGNDMFGINGNTKLSEPDTVWQTSVSTLASKTGKYYMEYKCEGNYVMIGCLDINNSKNGANDKNFGSSTDITSYGYGYYNADGQVYNAGSGSSFGNTYTSNDIMGVALDCDNKKMYFSKNGVWQNSGVPTSGSTGTGAVSLATGDDRCYVMACSVQDNNIGANFGNGYFGPIVISSAGTNASNNGIFEYDVPAGYTALSTKGLNI